MQNRIPTLLILLALFAATIVAMLVFPNAKSQDLNRLGKSIEDGQGSADPEHIAAIKSAPSFLAHHPPKPLGKAYLFFPSRGSNNYVFMNLQPETELADFDIYVLPTLSPSSRDFELAAQLDWLDKKNGRATWLFKAGRATLGTESKLEIAHKALSEAQGNQAKSVAKANTELLKTLGGKHVLLEIGNSSILFETEGIATHALKGEKELIEKARR